MVAVNRHKKLRALGSYSIKELEVLTGIKAHTIRIWEQRYNILAPNRTTTNIRFYTEEDLKHLLNISLLNKNGMKISRIAKMSDKQIRDKVLDLSESNFEFNNQIDSLVLAMIEFDEDSFEKIIATNILRIGFEDTFLNIIFPFLNRIGLLWQTAVIRPAQEHFMSNLIRQKIIVAIDGQMSVKYENSKRYMLYLPEREQHELSLLFMNFIIRSRGNHTLYLGANVPFDDTVAAFDDYKPDYILTLCIAYPGDNYVQDYINIISTRFADTTILMSGRQVLLPDVVFPSNIKSFATVEDCIDFVNENSEFSRSYSRDRSRFFNKNLS
jgi:DNA-binding transcriptional MerR regulator